MEENVKALIADDRLLRIDERLLRIDDVVTLTTLSKSCINLWVAQGKFIKPSSLSPTVKVWRLKDVTTWINAHVGEQS